MTQPATLTRYSPAWHHAQAAEERSWLDDWARLHLIPVLEQPEPTALPNLTARSH